jgi:hypothetical protein
VDAPDIVDVCISEKREAGRSENSPSGGVHMDMSESVVCTFRSKRSEHS